MARFRDYLPPMQVWFVFSPVLLGLGCILFWPAPSDNWQLSDCVRRSVTHGAELPDAVRRCEAYLAWRDQ